MSENLRKVLHNKGLEITFVVEHGVARVEYRSAGEFDLSQADEVILFVNDDHIHVSPTDAGCATGVIGEWAGYGDGPVRITTRVGEFFDGWEFDP